MKKKESNCHSKKLKSGHLVTEKSDRNLAGRVGFWADLNQGPHVCNGSAIHEFPSFYITKSFIAK
jgi:hypothetical protein